MTIAQIQNAYVAFFNRPADVAGLNYWSNYAGNSADLLNTFAESAEYKGLYAGLNNTQLVNAIYQNLFGRTPDVAGLNYWVTQLDNGNLKVGNIADAVNKGAQGTDKTIIENKTAAATAFTSALDTPAEIVAYAGVDSTGLQAVKTWLNTLNDATKTVASVTGAELTSVLNTVQNNNAGQTYTLTAGVDELTANVFNAPRDFTPGGTDQVNTLDDDDVLTGTGVNPTLNFSFVDDADIGVTVITPTLNGIETVNVTVQGNAAKNLDLQDATGVDSLNVSRVNASNLFQAQNINAATDNFSVNNSVNNAATVNFAHVNGALAGTADATALTLNGAVLNNLNMDNTVFNVGGVVVTAPTQGYETINLTSNGNANTVNVMGIYGNETLNISGASDLRLGAVGTAVGAVSRNAEASNFAAGLNGVNGFLTTVDASAMTGDLTYHIGAEIAGASSKNSGAPIQMAITGGAGDDTFVLTTGAVVGGAANDTDVINGGMGADKIVITGNAQINAATTANIRSVEALEIRTGHDAGVVADNVTVDADAFDSLATIFVRNEGQTGGTTAAEAATVNLVDLTAAQAAAITVAHGTTGNNLLNTGIAGAPGETQINVDLKTPGATDTVAVTIVNGLNTDVRSNFELNAISTDAGATQAVRNVENITINDTDTESNSILLTAATTNAFVVGANAAGHTGTVTLTGGQAGQFLNLDATANAYRYDLSGAAVDGGTVIAGTAGNRSDVGGGLAERLNSAVIDASAYLGNVIVRVSDNSADNLGGQMITMGAGNDTVIFDQIVNTSANFSKAGLTINDTVNGGAGNDILGIDGHGTAITLGASEWTNVSNFEIIRLIGNGVPANNAAGATNSYNLTLTNELLAANGVANGAGRQITIINDNDGANDIVTNGAAGADTAGTGLEGGVTIDLRALSAQNSIRYNGEEGVSRTADRFIFSDANLNASSVIDGGRVYAGANLTSNLANADVLEARNASVVSLGDLAGISNVGTIQFTNDTATVQTSQLTLDSATVDRLVNDGQAASATAIETLIILATDNPVLPAALTQLNLDASLVNNNFALNVTGGGGVDNIIGSAGNDIITGGAGADTITTGLGADRVTYTAAGQGGNTTTVASATAMTAGDVITDFATTVDDIVVTAAINGVGAAAAAGAAGTWNLNTNGAFVLTGVALDFVAGTTTAAGVATVIGNVTGDVGDRGYIAILDDAGDGSVGAAAANDTYQIFEVTLANARAGAAIATTDTISLVGTVNSTTFVAGDFIV